jgi:hypothetical protein
VFTRALREADRRRMEICSVREKQGLMPDQPTCRLQIDGPMCGLKGIRAGSSHTNCSGGLRLRNTGHPPTPHHPPRRRLRRSQYREAGGGEGSAAAGPRQLWRGRWTAATARSSSSGGSRTEVGGGIKPLAFGEFVEMGLIMGYQEPVPAEVLLTHVTGVAKRGADRHLIENRVGGSRGGVARPLNRSFPDLLFFS